MGCNQRLYILVVHSPIAVLNQDTAPELQVAGVNPLGCMLVQGFIGFYSTTNENLGRYNKELA